MSTIRAEFINVVRILESEFPQSNIGNCCANMLRNATAPDRPVSKWHIVTRRGNVAETWDATIAITDLRNTVSLAHREGFLDDDGFKQFEIAIAEWKEDLKVERVEDAFAILQKSLRRDARRLAKGG